MSMDDHFLNLVYQEEFMHLDKVLSKSELRILELLEMDLDISEIVNFEAPVRKLYYPKQIEDALLSLSQTYKELSTIQKKLLERMKKSEVFHDNGDIREDFLQQLRLCFANKQAYRGTVATIRIQTTTS